MIKMLFHNTWKVYCELQLDTSADFKIMNLLLKILLCEILDPQLAAILQCFCTIKKSGVCPNNFFRIIIIILTNLNFFTMSSQSEIILNILLELGSILIPQGLWCVCIWGVISLFSNVLSSFKRVDKVMLIPFTRWNKALIPAYDKA